MSTQYNKAKIIEKVLSKAAIIAEKCLESKEEDIPPEKKPVLPKPKDKNIDIKEQNTTFLQTVEKISQHTASLKDRIERSQSMPRNLKDSFFEIVNPFQRSLNQFIKNKKAVPTKINLTLRNAFLQIEKTTSDIIGEIEMLEAFGFTQCSSRTGSRRRLRIEHLKDLKRDIYFWENYLVLESNFDTEANNEKRPEEIVIKGTKSVIFNKNNFINNFRTVLEKFIPDSRPEQAMVEKVQAESKVQVRPVLQYQVDELRIAHECLIGLGRPQEIVRAFKIYLAEDEKDNIHVLDVLGQLYYEGEYVLKDYTKAADYFRRSCEKDNPEGYYRMGMMFKEGLLTPQNNIKIGSLDFKTDENLQARAIKCFNKAAEKNHPEAIIEISKNILKKYDNECQAFDAPLALSYIRLPPQESESQIKLNNNKDPVKDFEELKFYLKGRNESYPRVLEYLGLIHCMKVFRNINDEEKNIQKGIKYLTLASEMGSSEAKYLLGLGVGIDVLKARMLVGEAASKGNLKSIIIRIKDSFKSELLNNIEPDLLSLACDLNDILKKNPNCADALYLMGKIFERGLLEKNHRLAWLYFSKAGNLGYAPALNAQGNFLHSGVLNGQEMPLEAVKKYKEAAKLGYTPALNNLGVIYEEGWAGQIKQDEGKAKMYFEKAIAANDSDAMVHYSRLLEKEKNFEKANEHIIRAASLGNKTAKDLMSARGLNSFFIEKRFDEWIGGHPELGSSRLGFNKSGIRF